VCEAPYVEGELLIACQGVGFFCCGQFHPECIGFSVQDDLLVSTAVNEKGVPDSCFFLKK